MLGFYYMLGVPFYTSRAEEHSSQITLLSEQFLIHSPSPSYGTEDNFSVFSLNRPRLTCAKLHVHKVIEDNGKAPGQERVDHILSL